MRISYSYRFILKSHVASGILNFEEEFIQRNKKDSYKSLCVVYVFIIEFIVIIKKNLIINYKKNKSIAFSNFIVCQFSLKLLFSDIQRKILTRKNLVISYILETIAMELYCCYLYTENL